MIVLRYRGHVQGHFDTAAVVAMKLLFLLDFQVLEVFFVHLLPWKNYNNEQALSFGLHVAEMCELVPWH